VGRGKGWGVKRRYLEVGGVCGPGWVLTGDIDGTEGAVEVLVVERLERYEYMGEGEGCESKGVKRQERKDAKRRPVEEYWKGCIFDMSFPGGRLWSVAKLFCIFRSGSLSNTAGFLAQSWRLRNAFSP
jgi:hypothetical protein